MQVNEELTSRQHQTLKAIYSSLNTSGYPPTLADLREKLNVSSNQTVLDLLKILEEKKAIKKEVGTARSITILKNGFQILGVKPLAAYVGSSSAGPFVHSFEDVEWKSIGDVEELKDILVKATGDSMIGAGIENGDIVIIRKSKEFKNGDIVLARNDDETTIKRFVHDNGRVYLKTENPKYKNLPIYPDTRIIGKVVKVIGKS